MRINHNPLEPTGIDKNKIESLILSQNKSKQIKINIINTINY